MKQYGNRMDPFKMKSLRRRTVHMQEKGRNSYKLSSSTPPPWTIQDWTEGSSRMFFSLKKCFLLIILAMLFVSLGFSPNIILAIFLNNSSWKVWRKNKLFLLVWKPELTNKKIKMSKKNSIRLVVVPRWVQILLGLGCNRSLCMLDRRRPRISLQELVLSPSCDQINSMEGVQWATCPNTS